MPFVFRMSSWLYLAFAVVLSVGFCGYGFALWRNYSDALARKTFRFSPDPPERAVCCAVGGPLRDVNMNKRNAIKNVAACALLAGATVLFLLALKKKGISGH